MNDFPWFSDLGGNSPAGPVETWYEHSTQCADYYRYYSGLQFKQKAQMAESGDSPELYPVRMNLVKMLCHSQADALWGEWDDHVLTLNVNHPDKEKGTLLQKYLEGILVDNNSDRFLWETGLDQQRYGGSLLKVSPDQKRKRRIRIERVPVNAFYPVWNPDDMDDLLEAWVVTELNALSAQRYFGMKTDLPYIYRVEHWTKDIYETRVGGVRLDQHSGRNPWGIVPLAYTPRLRSDSFYGEALTEDIRGAQDELNLRVADNGDAITYNSHPLKYGYNLPKNINDRSVFSYDPDQLWNLGIVMQGQPEPVIKQLESAHPVPDAAFKHIKFVYDWGRTAASSPPVAFGEDEGSQRSGATLIIRMWPLTRAVKRSRSYNRAGLARLMDIVMIIGNVNRSALTDPSVFQTYKDGEVEVTMAPILPRERNEIVDEIVKRLSTTPHTISVEKALRDLGEHDVVAEIERIESDAEKSAKLAIKPSPPAKTSPEEPLKGKDDENSLAD